MLIAKQHSGETALDGAEMNLDGARPPSGAATTIRRNV